jgi:diguanylate cyclase (GGDEF)-like protein
LRRAAVIVGVLAIPLVVLGSIAAAQLAERERARADARLQAGLRTAGSELEVVVSVADADARRLAGSAAVQRALFEAKADAAARLSRSNPGLVVYARGHRLTGPEGEVLERTIDVLGPRGARLGRVGVAVPLDDPLLRRLQRRVGVPLLLEQGGAVAAGAAATAGLDVELDGWAPQTITLGSRRYRAIAGPLPDGQGRLVAIVAADPLDAMAHNRMALVGLAGLATLFALVIAVDALLPIIRRHVARRRAGEDEESLETLGSALASAHDPAALLPMVLESAVEATGAAGGVLEEGGLEIARTGDIPAGSAPLRLELAASNGHQVVALIYPHSGAFSAAERKRAERFVTQASVAVANARQHAIARRQAVTDPLTGLANRRRFMEQLGIEAKRRSRTDEPVALIVADLDDFKRVNDRHGHETGDAVLQAFAFVLKQTIRETDLAARLGGEEFAVLLSATDPAGAGVLADRLRARLAGLELGTPGGGRVTVTASFGLASCPPIERVEDLPAAADSALYRAKHEGKNRVAEAVTV